MFFMRPPFRNPGCVNCNRFQINHFKKKKKSSIFVVVVKPCWSVHVEKLSDKRINNFCEGVGSIIREK